MPCLLIGNDFTQDLRGDRTWVGWWVQRVLWFAVDGDVLVLPSEPDPAFLAYVTSHISTDPSSLRFIVPPCGGEDDQGTLTPDRIRAVASAPELRSLIANETIDRIVPLWPDTAVAQLAEAVGANRLLPGAGFMAQDGGRLVNSKSVFRALAGGIGVPVPPGSVCSRIDEAVDAIHALAARGSPAILKRDYLSGGRGNEIVSPDEEFRPIGARRVVVLPERGDVGKHLDEQWGEFTRDGRDRLVVEEYFRDSGAYYVEFEITDEAVTLRATGELVSAPFAVSQVIPAKGLDEAGLAALVDGGQRLCEALRAMGYRGYLSADAIATPLGEMYFTEYNGRVTGSTHLYACIGERTVGERFGLDRMLVDRVWPTGWSIPSFHSGVEALKESGLAFEQDSRRGVVFSSAYNPSVKGMMYSIVAADDADAAQMEQTMKEVFSATT